MDKELTNYESWSFGELADVQQCFDLLLYVAKGLPKDTIERAELIECARNVGMIINYGEEELDELEYEDEPKKYHLHFFADVDFETADDPHEYIKENQAELLEKAWERWDDLDYALTRLEE